MFLEHCFKYKWFDLESSQMSVEWFVTICKLSVGYRRLAIQSKLSNYSSSFPTDFWLEDRLPDSRRDWQGRVAIFQRFQYVSSIMQPCLMPRWKWTNLESLHHVRTRNLTVYFKANDCVKSDVWKHSFHCFVKLKPWNIDGMFFFQGPPWSESMEWLH
jgi:hypothetical protein